MGSGEPGERRGRRAEVVARWQAEAAAARAAVEQWREQHPTATFTEIEEAVDQELDTLRAQVLADVALASRAADLQDKSAGPPPRCPRCGERLVSQGKHHRRVQVRGSRPVDLYREYAVCPRPTCGLGLSPPG